MPSNVQSYAQMADHAATQITGSHQDWTDFLTTAARLYKYPYNEQLMIYAQRPDATACADYDVWNEKMRRYVRRGSKGIALIDASGDKPRIHYVFDISDTGGGDNSHRPFLWQYRPEHEDTVTAALERAYDVSGNDGLADQLERIAVQLADEYWQDNQYDLLRIVDDSFLEEYDNFNIGVQFRNAATASITYALMSRCGLTPDDYFAHEDFLSIFDFNTPATVAALGTAVSEVGQQVLRQIEVTIKKYEREHLAERSATHGEQPDLQPERGLPDTRPDDHGADGEHRQVREDAEELPEGTPPGTIQQPVAAREAVPAPAGDRADGDSAAGADDAGTDEVGGRGGEPESQRPDEMGGLDEQPESPSGGNYSERAGLQLSFFPSEEEQIQIIDEAESVIKTPFAFSFKQDEIDHVLCLGSNADHSRLRVCAKFKKNKSLEEIADFLKAEYRGGSGFLIGHGNLSAWYAEDGVHLSQGTGARYVKNAQIIPWRAAAERIGQLLEQGSFTTNVELAEVDGYERTQLAETLWYLRNDMEDEGRQLFLGVEVFQGGFPDSTARLANMMAEPESLAKIIDELIAFVAAYEKDRSLLRFHYYRPRVLLDGITDLQLPRREYVTDMMALPEIGKFITDDEVNAALTYGSSVEGGKGRIYAYFSEPHTTKEQVDFLKNEYGTGGHSHAVSGSSRSYEDHSAKGVKLTKGDCTAVELSWSNVAKRIKELINKGRYLTPEEKARFEEIQRDKAGMKPAPELSEQSGTDEPELTEDERIDLEAERAIDTHEAEFGADGYRAFPGSAPDMEDDMPAPVVTPRAITQDDIDRALQEWNGDTDSKRRVAEYMAEHARDKNAAAFLRAEYGDDLSVFPVTTDGAALDLPWTKVQRRIGQLTEAGQFTIEAERSVTEPVHSEVDEMLAYAEKITAESAVEQYERFAVVETDEGYAIWDDIRDEYYVDDDGLTESFTSEWQANNYLAEVRKAVSDKDAAEWLYVERSKNESSEPEPEVSPERRAQIIEAMSAADLSYDEIDSSDSYLVFRDGNGSAYTYQSWDEAAEWIDGVGFDDPERSTAAERVMYPERFSETTETPSPQPESVLPEQDTFPYAVGDTIYLEDSKPFIIENIGSYDIRLRDPSLIYPIFRSESRDSFMRLMGRYPQPEREQSVIQPAPENFRITDNSLGVGGAKAKYAMNVAAINLLKELEFDGRQATPEEQEVLSRYVGWGGLPQAFDENNSVWSKEFTELYTILSPEEYASARASTLNAHYTSPTVIRAIYEAVGNMGFTTGNILEPAMGVGNFFGLLPEEMSASKLYGVELDSITGRIAKQLYPNADITVAGFETTDRRDFYDLAVGNVPFGQYKVADKAYDKLGFSIHDYFFAKSIDQVRPGGVVAFVTSRYTMDKQSPEVRRYIAERAELLGAIRLPNTAFKANAGTEVVSDILFLQKRDRPIVIDEDWIHLEKSPEGFDINSYFVEHPDMILGTLTVESTQYGRAECTVVPTLGADLAAQLSAAIKNIGGQITEAELPDLGDGEKIDASIPSDPNVKNFSYTVVDGEVYFRENSRMVRPELNITAKDRVRGMVELRDCVQKLIGQQLDGFISDTAIRETQAELNALYDKYTDKYGLINSRSNALAFADDSSYYLLCSLEVLDEEGNLDRKADMFTKRTIKQNTVVTSVDTASEALALSIAEKACVDMEYMTSLTGRDEETLAKELSGVIFKDFVGMPDGKYSYRTGDEFLSGNVREKLRKYEKGLEYASERHPNYPYILTNVEALRAAQPKDLDASEIEVRLGATWIGKEYVQEFMYELLAPPYYLRRNIEVNFSEFTAEWNITGKNSMSYNDINSYVTYGTDRANAYRILEDSLNLRDVRIYDTVQDADGKERRILNSKETTLAQQKQQAIKDAFRDWIWKDPERRQTLVQKYNEIFNSCRPREYDGRHITFSGMNPEISLREHQLNAVAHVLYGGNTLLAHEVGAGKTFEMVAAAMESKRLGLSQKSLFAVPNHLTEQWASEFLRLYPSANILVATKKDFETRNRKKFCARIATGDYDAVIIGHSQFEKIPVSKERQEHLLQEQIYEIEDGLAELKASRAERFTIKQLERTKKSLEVRLEKLNDGSRKDDVVTFEQLGVDRLYVDEAHNYKNCFLYTKMRNVAGLSTTDAQKSSDMLLKCRYIDEITDNRGVIFATGTPVSNSMTELYTMMRYLQHDTIKRQGLSHFDCWASTFGETTTAIELAPEGTGYRARTRFAKFFNLPELMTLFKEVADIKTADQLNLPTPTPIYHNVVAQPTDIQKEMVQELSERAAVVHSGTVDPSVDNMLKITSDGRKLGLDQRVINPQLPDDPQSKVNMCVDNICRIWQDGQADKLTQLVFCDISTPKGKSAQRAAKAAEQTINGAELHALEAMLEQDGGTDANRFTVYEDIRAKLIAKGVPSEQIAFIHDADTEVRKKELFAKVRSGSVRVLLGSTFKMGSGMNVQDRLAALHDLDCPWRPGDLEQRSGRIIRQGNKNAEVHIFRYVTEGTFDSYLWQTVENKQKFISQIMTSKSPVRSCEDIDATALSYAEIKALCAGDERIKQKMDLDIDVARLRLMKANHQSQQYRLEDNLLKYFPEQVEKNKGFIAGFEADIATLAAHPHPEDGFAGMTVRRDNLVDKDNAGAAILEACKEVKGLDPIPIGNYRGFTMSLTLENFMADYVLTIKGQMTHRVTLGKDARGNLTRIDNALAAMPERLKNVQSQLENLYSQMETAKAEVGKPFPQEEELQQKSARLAELNAELDIDGKSTEQRQAAKTIAKSERPSVLDKLRAPCISGMTDKKKTHDLEAR